MTETGTPVAEKVDTNVTTEKKKHHKKENHGYKTKTGKEIAVCFIDGKTMRGKLIEVQQYDIIIEVKKGDETHEVTIFKHAVKYVM